MVVLSLFCAIAGSPPLFAAGVPEGLVGRWGFDDGTGKDLSGNGNDAVLGGTRIYSLGKGRACIQLAEDDEPMFVLLARDPVAALLVRHWAELRIMYDILTCDQQNEAIACADAMEKWANDHPDHGPFAK